MTPDFNPIVLTAITNRLAAAGCIAAEEEARELATSARGDVELLNRMVERRATGEPLAWITGGVLFGGCQITVSEGVFVPRWQSESLARRAAELLPARGRAIDLGTGCGAIARVLSERRPEASVLGTEADAGAARCARRNGVTVVEGDLFQGVPAGWRGTVDVVVAVLPYVPTSEIAYLPRDVQAFEPILALDGGEDGLNVIRRAVSELRGWLRDGGHVLFEIGGDQPAPLTRLLEAQGFGAIRIGLDADGDPRSIEASALAMLG